MSVVKWLEDMDKTGVEGSGGRQAKGMMEGRVHLFETTMGVLHSHSQLLCEFYGCSMPARCLTPLSLHETMFLLSMPDDPEAACSTRIMKSLVPEEKTCTTEYLDAADGLKSLFPPFEKHESVKRSGRRKRTTTPGVCMCSIETRGKRRKDERRRKRNQSRRRTWGKELPQKKKGKVHQVSQRNEMRIARHGPVMKQLWAAENEETERTEGRTGRTVLEPKCESGNSIPKAKRNDDDVKGT